jgi:LPXTG-site transpeptidase (sortase) family protein
MSRKIFSKITLGTIFTLALFTISLTPFFQAFSKSSNLTIKNGFSYSNYKSVAVGLPVRLSIPKIKVDSLVESVGLKADGSLAVPKDPFDVAWYNFGPRPGEIGSAVIDGHSGWINHVPVTFDNLNQLETGDKIYIIDNQGATTTFVVREKLEYDSTANIPEVFHSEDGQAHLNLITCAGDWNPLTQNYAKRLVIFSTLERQ